jgi:hypothetical protein
VDLRHGTAPKSVEIPLARDRAGGEGWQALSIRTLVHLGGLDPMPDMTADDLKEHLEIIQAATTEDLDELLHDLLVRVYPSKKTQDS